MERHMLYMSGIICAKCLCQEVLIRYPWLATNPFLVITPSFEFFTMVPPLYMSLSLSFCETAVNEFLGLFPPCVN